MKKIFVLLLLGICLFAVSACGTEQPGDEPPEDTYCFVFQDTEIRVGAKLPSVLEGLRSQEAKVSVKPSCLNGVSGEDVTYVYNGFQIKTFRTEVNDPNEEIRWIILIDDLLMTPEGITIWSSVEAVKAAYGDATKDTGEWLYYQKGSCLLGFSYRDGLVTKIEYSPVD